MNAHSRRWQFVLFFLSGLSGLVYQIVWLRLAFAAFGVVTPVISVVLSVFMMGLGLGSWMAGTTVRRWPWSRDTALRVYSGAEFLIGIGGFAVPLLFAWGEWALLPVGETDSVAYLVSSAGVIALALAPFCLCMGITFPVMLQAIRAERDEQDSFSYLYLANVLGAMCGTLLTPLLLVEVFGFQGALMIAVASNWTASLISLRMSLVPSVPDSNRPVGRTTEPSGSKLATNGTPPPATPFPFRRFPMWILFTTGMASMGMEVVWARAFTPVLKTQVYSFAGLLFTYLLATWGGSALYRRHLARQRAWSDAFLLGLLALAAFAQLLQADPRLAFPAEGMQSIWLLLGIVPYCGILGYLTPKLIDEFSHGQPGPAGHAYAINILGCIIGPLLASYLLLPRLGVQASGLMLAAPLWLLAGLAAFFRRNGASAASATGPSRQSRFSAVGLTWGISTVLGILAATVGTSYEDQYASHAALVLRDHTATVIATHNERGKEMLVNGKPITSITPSTKLMAHLPLASLTHEPQSALVICFGMGTTYRSLLSWGIEAVAVELVPSVRDAFGYYFKDADAVQRNPRGQILIDDGRRYLKRTTRQFDVITLDPPPPPEAAASSLLYSREFYQLVKLRLTDQGILHQWFPGGELNIFLAVLRSVTEEFPYVTVMRGYDGWGYHILASRAPIPDRTDAELDARLPETARADLLEWSPRQTAKELFSLVLQNRFQATDVLDDDPRVVITDNRPYNEYYLLRRAWQWWTGTYTIVL